METMSVRPSIRDLISEAKPFVEFSWNFVSKFFMLFIE